ncbi:MAG: DUF6378 domain-containing protein [Oscillospiraceae bacterium]|nr:DUF6378 domain-containing protein [Oscillospiraceae bacterium]
MGVKQSIREQILKEAMSQINGKPEQDFKLVADMWSSYTGTNITALDVAMMMCLLEVTRIKNGRGSEDSFVGLAGYASCGAEIRAADNLNEFISKAKEEYGTPAEYEETSQQDVSFF